MALSIAIIFSHMYTLGQIPARRQKGFYFSFLWSYWGQLGFWQGLSHPKEEPWNQAHGSNLEGSDWWAPGHTSATEPSVLGMILIAHGALPWKGWCTWGIPARTPCTDCERTWKSLSCDVSMLVKAGGVGRVWAQEWRSAECCSDKQKYFTAISSWRITVLPSFQL